MCWAHCSAGELTDTQNEHGIGQQVRHVAGRGKRHRSQVLIVKQVEEIANFKENRPRRDPNPSHPHLVMPSDAQQYWNDW